MEKVPVLVCLTFADKLYAEHMSDDGKHPEKEAMKFQLQQELMVGLNEVVSALAMLVFLGSLYSKRTVYSAQRVAACDLAPPPCMASILLNLSNVSLPFILVYVHLAQSLDL